MKLNDEVYFSPCKYNFVLLVFDINLEIIISVWYMLPSLFFLLVWFQIQNADDVLITPLEKFRKEQIGAAKVRDHLHKPIFLYAFIYCIPL